MLLNRAKCLVPVPALDECKAILLHLAALDLLEHAQDGVVGIDLVFACFQAWGNPSATRIRPDVVTGAATWEHVLLRQVVDQAIQALTALEHHGGCARGGQRLVEDAPRVGCHQTTCKPADQNQAK